MQDLKRTTEMLSQPSSRVTRSRSRTGHRINNRARLMMEPLENRTVPSATPVGTQFMVDPRLAAPENPPAVAILDSTGDFVAVWQSFEQDGSGFGIFAKLMHSDGTYVDVNGDGVDNDAFQVNVTATGDQLAPAVASDGAGHFIGSSVFRCKQTRPETPSPDPGFSRSCKARSLLPGSGPRSAASRDYPRISAHRHV